ncbi:gliding motility-associated ABC transporter substrate-binding protein GldG [Roseivirga misakiensis]|uniref:Gliding motility-associated ABC transporter substrate-binding protein GldG n=1 Tax=Roseivirga misakiensis TaxID=1563681 RepID=A0A1E5T2A9_9BACT|nr:gliding motility-associated ABC transporter substrate-binding protein GldG [Roseivirga misakiensis]
MASRFLSFKPKRVKIWRQFAISLVVVLVLNIVSANAYLRLDLTADKRFTLKPATTEMLNALDKPLTMEILLAGDLPPKYQRLNKALVQTLKEFNEKAGSNINFFQTDPSEAANEQERRENYDYLMERLRLSPTQAIYNENGNQVRRYVFPYVIMNYDGQSAAVEIAGSGKVGLTPDEVLNQAAENLEFNLAVGIQRLSKYDRKKVGLITGYGELDSLDIIGFGAEMVQYFDLEPIDIRSVESIQGFDAIVVSKPMEKYQTDDKFKLDQFIMNGGKAIFLIDGLSAEMNRAEGAGTIAFPIDHGLDDLLFKYGVRINKNYVQDIQNFGRFPVFIDDQDNLINLPWPFYASINEFAEHPVTKNLDAVYARTFGTIDTVKAVGIRKTPFMFTSEATRVIAAGGRVAFEDYANPPDPSLFQHGKEAVAYLLEGKFSSVFRNRVLSNDKKDDFKEESLETKIIVASDGDLIRNERDLKTGAPMELGINPFADRGEKVMYANKDFLFNALTYLTDENGLITARAKEVTLRPLNRLKVQEERAYWQVLNLVGPLLIIILFGVTRGILRKRKYGAFSTSER